MTKRLASLAIIAAVVAQPAASDDYVFKGDCDRARIVKAERTINLLIPYDTYKGVQRANFANDSCGRDSALFYNLTKIERSTTRMVFSLLRVQVNLFNQTGACPNPEYFTPDVTGSVTMDLRLNELGGGLCELYVWTDWKQEQAGTTWRSDFANRMIPTDGGSFVVAQPSPSDGKFYTPLAFSGL